MLKTISFIILGIFLLNINLNTVKAEDDYFVVTAYYSPLPNQKYYMRGNFENEKILQWEWTHWASWKKVFSWMLAWPKNYAFWTKIELEWLWVWVIEDRWQAIVNKWQRWYKHDRLDVWMWYWDEWLKRTLAWWKRKVKWKIIEPYSEVTINYKNHPAPESAIFHLKKKEKTAFDLYLWKSSKNEDVKVLQKLFRDLWLYNWEIDWIYNEQIIKIVYDFQLKNNIVKSENDFWAWYWWEKTKTLFKEKYNKGILSKKQEVDFDTKKIIENSSYDIFWNFVNTRENIENIEKIFLEIGFYNWKITWDINNLKSIILDYQLKENIVSSKDSPWAWNFWPKTRASLKYNYEIFQDKKIEENRKKIAYEEKLAKIKLKSEEKTKNILNLKKWDIWQEVRELQEILLELWYFNEKTTAIYWNKTFESIVKFQLDNNLIDKKESIYAWIIWERTLAKIKESLEKIYKLEKNINIAYIWKNKKDNF